VTDRQTVLIAGATGNVGGGAAVALARRGTRVVLLGRKTDTLEARAAAIRAASAADGIEDAVLETLSLEISDMDDVRRAAAEALERFPSIDALILSVVYLGQHGPRVQPDGHELMFKTNVVGPFLFTELLAERLQRSEALVMHVVAPFYEAIDWNDLESIEHYEDEPAYHRTKTMNRMMAAELARRYEGSLASVAFDPGFIIDKHDPALKERWPSGFTGIYWRVLSALVAKPPRVAGEPMADLVERSDRQALNGAHFKLSKRVTKPDKAMSDEAAGRRLWDELSRMTQPSPAADPADGGGAATPM
jgi:NAD(P)-dependent dehydrogenase (short-subunit alcohol dehydrogenase family)